MREEAQALAQTLVAPSGAPEALSEEPEAHLTGARLDHFQLGERIGHGGMGDVYEARDTSLERPVAIKVLRTDVTSLPGMTERFLREARAQARFNHPNIVHIYYIGRRVGPAPESDALFFAMERVQGGDLEDLLASGATMDPEDARLAMVQVARALRAAHRAGVIHRDIKPSNLMLDADGVLKVTDFGLAKPLDGDSSITQEGALVGSPYYMAPEQAVADEIDHRADMYSLGACFFHLLTGRPLFEGTRPMSVIAQHLSSPPPSLSVAAPHVPPALQKVIGRLLSKKPEERYDDYDALIVALEEAAPQQRAFSPFPTRAVAALGDFVIAGLLIGLLGSWGWLALVLYLFGTTAGHALRGQTLAKFLLGIEVVRVGGGRIGWARSCARTFTSLWLPLLIGALIALTSGIPELLSAIEGLQPASIEELHSVLMAMAISHGFLTLLYFAGLSLALFSTERRALHDLVADSVVVYRLKHTVLPPSTDGLAKMSSSIRPKEAPPSTQQSD